MNEKSTAPPRHDRSTDELPRAMGLVKDEKQSGMDQGVPPSLTVDKVLRPQKVVKRRFNHISSSISCSGQRLIHLLTLLTKQEMG